MCIATAAPMPPAPETEARPVRPGWITLAAACRLLGQSERFVLAQAMMGKIRTLRGPTVRYHQGDCEALAKQIYDPR
jgi:hypothetical protein